MGKIKNNSQGRKRNSIKTVGVFFTALVLTTFFVGALAFGDITPSTGLDKQANKVLLEKVFKLQMPFIENQGQMADEHVRFYSKIFGGTVFVTDKGEMIYSLTKTEPNSSPTPGKRHKRAETITKAWALKEELIGASIGSPQGMDKTQTKVNYFIGNDKGKWKTDLTTYNAVNVGEIYKGIDLKLKAYGKNVEKIFTVNPGADPKTINLRIEGATSLTINDKGELEVETGLGPVSFAKPVAFQEINGKRHEVKVSYNLLQNSEFDVYDSSPLTPHFSQLKYGFKVDDYDKSLPLIIDPLLGSTFLGGTGLDEIYSIAIDSSGSVYVAGITSSSNFPGSAGGLQGSFGGGTADAFISKFNSSLTTLTQSTYLGGSGIDYAIKLALDGSGYVYVAGATDSTNFPGTTGGAQPSFGGGNRDAFISKLNSTLTTLIQSTYLGGSGDDYLYGLAIDGAGNVYVAGATNSTPFPGTSGGAQASFNGGGNDAFISKLNSSLTTLIQSTYLGGTGNDNLWALTVDGTGNAYVAGDTTSTDFPGTAGHYQPNKSGGGSSDVFVSKLSTSLTGTIASTYLGGTGSEGVGLAGGMAIDNSGNVYVAGATGPTTGFPTTPGAYDTALHNNVVGFISKLNANLTALSASTFLGPNDNSTSFINSIGIDGSGNVHVFGATDSTNFPGTAGGVQPFGGVRDAFISKLNPNLTTLMASSYLGGADSENPYPLAFDGWGNIYVAGSTPSTNFPTTASAYQGTNQGSLDAFVSKFPSNLASGVGLTLTPSGGGTGTIRSLPPGINCGSDCSESYGTGTIVTLTAAPDTGSYFAGWSGDCISQALTCKVTMDVAKNVTATFNSGTPPVTTWAKTYGGSGDDYAYSIQQTSDGGYIMAGNTTSFGIGDNDIWILKLNPDGSLTGPNAWQKSYPSGSTDDKVYSIQQTSDGGYIAAGSTASAGGYDFWVLKLNADGSLTGTNAWQKTYGGLLNHDYAYSIQQTSDGGYILAGHTHSFGAGSIDILVLKLKANGEVDWQKTYGGAGDDYAYSVQQSSDGGYIVAGHTNSFGGSEYYDIWVLKLNADGSVAWQKTYGGNSSDFGASIQQTSDGGYIVAGSTYSFGAGAFDIWVLKLNADGSLTGPNAWQKTYGGSGYEYGSFIQQTSDGGYIVVGETSPSGTGGRDILVLKLNADGSLTGPNAWQKTYGGPNEDSAYSLQQTSDGGYIVAGYTSSYGVGNSDVWVLKLDSNGNINGCPGGLIGTSAAVVGTPTITITTPTPTIATSSATITNTNVTPATAIATPEEVCTGIPACSYSIDPTSASYPAGGGGGSVSVIAPPGCPWTATSNAAWITITSGFSGSGNGTVYYTVAANSGSAWTGTMTIAGHPFGVYQAGIADGVVIGRVTDASTGSPMGDVAVYAYDLASNPVTGTMTLSDGTYFLPLPPGTYKIFFAKWNEFYLLEWYNNKKNFNAADPVTVTVGQITPNINAQLDPAGKMSGLVTDASTGDPLADVAVYAYDLSSNPIDGTMTLSDGTYFLPLPPGTYKIFFAKWNEFYLLEWFNNKKDFNAADPVTVTVGQITPNINAQLDPGGKISGLVTDASTGNPIANVAVYAYDLSSNPIDGTMTFSDGTYFLPLLPGTYKVFFAKWDGFYLLEWFNNKKDFNVADPVTVTVAQITPNINAQLDPAGKISGLVTDATTGYPIAHVVVNAYDLNGIWINGSSTDSNGNYIFAVPPGSCKVYFDPLTGPYQIEWYNNKQSSIAADPVNVTINVTTSNINAQLSPKYTFDQNMIDPTVWADLEVFRRININNGVLESQIRRHGSNGNNYLAFYDSGSFNSFKADVTIKDYENSGSVPHAGLLGFAYNDGTSGDGHTGDVLGIVGIRVVGTQLQGFYNISKCTAPNCNLQNELVSICGALLEPAVLKGQTIPISFSWDELTSTFTFGFNGTNYDVNKDTTGCSSLPVKAGPPNLPNKSIGARIAGITNGTNAGGYISATFDNVKVGISDYDTFDSPPIDRTKWWGTLEIFRMALNGELVSELTQRGANGSNNMSFVNSQAILGFEADLKVTEFQNTGARPQGRIYAALYNDGTGSSTPGDITGDVIASAGILDNGQGLGPQAYYVVSRCTAPACNLSGEYEILYSGIFKDVALDEFHKFSISWNGINVALGCDGNVIFYNPTSVVSVGGPPRFGKGIGTRVIEISNANEWAYVAASFDNVVITEVDTDLDGLGDTWEMANFGNLGQGAMGNPDGDGLTNLQEYQLGTNPNQANGPYTITVSPPVSNGTVTCDPTTVIYAQGSTCTITANDGYHVDNVLVDGGSVGAPSSYPFEIVKANHTISATFASNPTYTITASAASGGTISPSGSVPVPYDGSQLFTITTDPGAIVMDVIVDGVGQGPLITYTFDHVLNDHTINVVFALGDPPTGSGTAPDSDQDGVNDAVDNCPNMANPIVASWTDINGVVHTNSQKDTDLDGIGDECDTCPDVYNPDQKLTLWYKDFDDDGYSDGTNYPSCRRPKVCSTDTSLPPCTPKDANAACPPGCTGTWVEMINARFAFKSASEKLCSNARTVSCDDTHSCGAGQGNCVAALKSLSGDANDTNPNINPGVPVSNPISFAMTDLTNNPPKSYDEWLPFDGAKVMVTAAVTGGTLNSLTVLSVTNWPGKYTNHAPTASDYNSNPDYNCNGAACTQGMVINSPSVELTSLDFGGSITIHATATLSGGGTVTNDFTLPKDSLGTGLPGPRLPDSWQMTKFGVLGVSPTADADGDGLTNFQEYRGFMWGDLIPYSGTGYCSITKTSCSKNSDCTVIAGCTVDTCDTCIAYATPTYVPARDSNDNPIIAHFRTDPRKKDLFVKFSNNYDRNHPFAIGTAFKNAGVDVHAVPCTISGSICNTPGPLEYTGQPILVVYANNNKTGAYSDSGSGLKSPGHSNDGRIAQRTTGVRNWEWATKGFCQPNNPFPITYQKALDNYFNQKPYTDGGTCTSASCYGSTATYNTTQSRVLDPIGKVEDRNDDGTNTKTSNPTVWDTGSSGGPWRSDRVVSGSFNQVLTAFDIDNNGLVELPLASDPGNIDRTHEYTKAHVLKHTITHELGHAVGMNHNYRSKCLMYNWSSDWSRDDYFSDIARGQMNIHNP